MSPVELLRWQWNGYPRNHRARANLLIHIVFVPLFLAGNIGLVIAVLNLAWFQGVVSLAAMLFAIVMQGRGHHQEAAAPEPFTSPANAIARIFLEQWVTFPRFVMTGAWRRAMGNAESL